MIGFDDRLRSEWTIDLVGIRKLGANGVLLTSSNAGSTAQVGSGMVGTVPVVTVRRIQLPGAISGHSDLRLPRRATVVP